MTSPVSPSETIAKAMEGVEKGRLLMKVCADELGYGYAVPVQDNDGDYITVEDAKRIIAPLALQLEAMEREMAEKDAERRMIVSHATMGGTDGEGMSVNAVSVEITRLRNQLMEDTRARALIQGEKP